MSLLKFVKDKSVGCVTRTSDQHTASSTPILKLSYFTQRMVFFHIMVIQRRTRMPDDQQPRQPFTQNLLMNKCNCNAVQLMSAV